MPRKSKFLTPTETKNPLLFLEEEEKEETNPILGPNQLRQDGRPCTELRPVAIQSGIVSHVTSSAYIELGDTKVLCSILGPRHTGQEFSLDGQVSCHFKYAPFSRHSLKSTQQEEKMMSSIISEALVAAILTETFPKLEIVVNLMILEDDGSALTAAILCASIAMATSGIQMKDLPTACTVSYSDKADKIYYDPIHSEEFNTKKTDIVGHQTVVYLPSLNKIGGVHQVGVVESHSISSQLVDACTDGGLRYHKRMREYLKNLSS